VRQRRRLVLIIAAVAVSSSALAYTGDIGKYLRIKPPIAMLTSTLAAADLEQCLNRAMTAAWASPALIYKADGRTTVAIFRYFVIGSATFETAAPVTIEVRSKQGIAATKQCLGPAISVVR